jgi:hypothetical protein
MPNSGILNQELIDQLVAANGEQEASDWIQKQRTVLLSHPGQVFSGQLRRYETKRTIGTSPLYWLWEKEFVKTAGISFFHRFRAVDQMNVACAITTLTTVLPPKRKLPFFLTRRPNHYFCVPSEFDSKLLQNQFHISSERIYVAKPTIRRFLHFQQLAPMEKPVALFLVEDKKNQEQLTKLLRIVKMRYPNWESKIVAVKNKEPVGPKLWAELLSNAQICFYLCSKPFDWGTLALESLFFKIPTVFGEENHALTEILPQSSLTLNKFLLGNPSREELNKETEAAWCALKSMSLFDPLCLASQYKEFYQQIVPGLNQ